MDNKKPTLGDETRFIFSKNELTDNEFLESINVQISEFGYYKLLSLKKENKGVASSKSLLILYLSHIDIIRWSS